MESALNLWDGEETELAQVHNALGYAYFQLDKTELAIEQYKQAVDLQPGYVTAWNNFGDALEKGRDLKGALQAYEEALTYSPDNQVAAQRAATLRTKLGRRLEI